MLELIADFVFAFAQRHEMPHLHEDLPVCCLFVCFVCLFVCHLTFLWMVCRQDKKFGVPPGCTEIIDLKRSYGQKVMEAASSSTAIGKNEVENTWRHVAKANTFNVSEVKDADGSLAVTSGAPKRGRDDFDDLVDFSFSLSSSGPPPKKGARQAGVGNLCDCAAVDDSKHKFQLAIAKVSAATDCS